MKAVFYNIFGLGHIHPTLPLVQKLVERGVDLTYHSHPSRRALIENAGAHFSHYGYEEYKAADFNPGAPFILQTLPAAVGLLPFLEKQFAEKNYDVILYDAMAPWGKVLAQIQNVPSFCTVPTMAFPDSHKQQTLARAQLAEDATNRQALDFLAKEKGVTLQLSEALGSYGPENIVFTVADFNPPLEPTPQRNFHFVGSMTERQEDTQGFPWARLDGRKVIYFSLGTLTVEEDPRAQNLFEAAAQAFTPDDQVLVVISSGRRGHPPQLAKVPDHVLLCDFVPQLALLEKTDLFITHAGMNSLNEGLALGVPLLALPHSKDQFANAERLSELQLGAQLPWSEVDATSLRHAAFDVLDNSIYANNVAQIQKSFDQAPGLDFIVEKIFNSKAV